MLGGAVAWGLHLISASLISEWGCFAGLHAVQYQGVTLIAWLLTAVSLLCVLIAGWATWVAWRWQRMMKALPASTFDIDAPRETDAFLARTGTATSGLFLFIILAESLPILFYLSDC
jgi:hypothetical protein